MSNDRAERPDAIDGAIAAADVPEVFRATLRFAEDDPSRFVGVELPIDVTAAEIVATVAFLTGQVAPSIAQARLERAVAQAEAGVSRIQIPTRPRLVVPS